MGDLTKNFSRREFACKCGCGFDDIDPRVVIMAQVIRDALGEPVRVNSGCRCAKRNVAVGGVLNSYHAKGLAVDLSCVAGSEKLCKAIKALFQAGNMESLEYCHRYINEDFVHIDVGHRRAARFVES
jgi:uncharacterized protein YcbK (DUF882 family)